MAIYGFTWRFITNDDEGTGYIEGPGEDPQRPLNLTLDEEDAAELLAEIDGLPVAAQDDRIKGFYAARVHEEVSV
jgi:hypothetical protein